MDVEIKFNNLDILLDGKSLLLSLFLYEPNLLLILN